jgi:hypothetical protein
VAKLPITGYVGEVCTDCRDFVMALMTSFEHKSMDRHSIHDGISATYCAL